MLHCRISAVQSFPVPICPDQVRQFLGLAGFYSQFIQHFIFIALPLTHLLKKNAEFVLSEKEQSAVEQLKLALLRVPVLAFPNIDKEFTLCTDASGLCIGAVLMQQDDNNKHRFIACDSRLINKAEQKYDVENRKSLSVI